MPKNYSNDQKQTRNNKKISPPTTLIQLIVYIVKSIIKNFPKIILRMTITVLVVHILHTYLLVYLNQGFWLDPKSKVLQYILMVIDNSQSIFSHRLRTFNVTLFWILLSSIIWGTVAQIKTNGIKLFCLRILNYLTSLISDIF